MNCIVKIKRNPLGLKSKLNPEDLLLEVTYNNGFMDMQVTENPPLLVIGPIHNSYNDVSEKNTATQQRLLIDCMFIIAEHKIITMPTGSMTCLQCKLQGNNGCRGKAY